MDFNKVENESHGNGHLGAVNINKVVLDSAGEDDSLVSDASAIFPVVSGNGEWRVIIGIIGLPYENFKPTKF